MDIIRIAIAAFLAAACANATPSGTMLSSSASHSLLGQSVTLTATVAPPGGTGKVTFYDGVLVLGIVPIAGGQAVLSTSLLPFGTHSLTAYYNGDANLAASRSAAVTVAVNAGAANGFQAMTNISVGSSPAVAAVDDFNGDGFADMVIVNRSSSNLTVLLGNGDGTFRAGMNYVSQAVFTVATGDFNGDGKRDLVIADSGNSRMSVALGNGDGTFQPAITSPASPYPISIVVGDFNGDGMADIATVNQFGTSNVTVLLGNGDGTFQAGINYLYSASALPCCLAAGDFNGDGKTDLVVANYGSGNVSVLLGAGDGTFQPAVTSGAVSRSGGPDAIAVGDFNGDGKSDIVMTQNFSNQVSVLLGNGDGKFQTAVNYEVGNQPYDVLVGDFNGDGQADFAVSNTGDNTVSVFPGNGDGTFQPGIIYPTGHYPLGAAVGDFNGDGKTDLAVTNGSVNSVSILLGRLASESTTALESSPNPSNFGQSVMLTAVVSPASATGSIVFYDGAVMLGTAKLSGGQASVSTLALGSGTRSLTAFYAGDATNMASRSAVLVQTVGAPSMPANGFQGVVNYGAGLEPLAVAVGDFNGDGIADVVAANVGGVAGGSSVSILLGNGDGTFQPALDYAAGNGSIAVAVADLNGDGKADLVVANYFDNTVSVLIGNGDGTFQAAAGYAAGHTPISVAIGDFNGDGKLDLAVANYTGSTSSGQAGVKVLLGNGDGTFQPAVNYAASSFLFSIVVGDFNGDGKQDLAVGGDFGLAVLSGNGDGTFQAQVAFGGLQIYSMAVGDFNGDGYPDLAAAGYNGGVVSVWMNNGLGGFKQPSNDSTGTYPRSVVAGDFNGDGMTDLAVANYGVLSGGSVSVLAGNGDGTFQTAVDYSSTGNPTSVAAGDLNGDGRADIVAGYANNSIGVMLGSLRPVSAVTLSSSQNPSGLSQTVTLTAAVSPADATGSVTFFDGTTVLGTNAIVGGQASLVIRFTKPGSHSLTAYYGGNASYAASTSAAVTESVSGSLFTSIVSESLSPNPARYGQMVTVTATVMPPAATGRVSFFQGAAVLGTSPVVNGQATLSTQFLASGAAKVTATYSGDANYVGSSAAVRLQVAPAASSGFQAPVSYLAGANPFGAATGDFNGDGQVDLAVANSGDNTVSILLGNGDGTFQPAVSYGAGAVPYAVAVGDFNGDGIADLAVANNGGGTVSVLLGNGDGTFQAAMSAMAGSGPYAIVAGDFNNDGRLDLAVANQLSSNFSILLGNGDGTFEAPVNYLAGNYPDSIAVTDWNGDGVPDLLVADQLTGVVVLFYGVGDGTFRTGGGFGIGPGAGPTAVAAADFNGDGFADFAVSNYSGAVRVVVGHGNSGSGPVTSYSAGLYPWSLAAADIDGDGNFDLVVANEGGNTVSVLPGTGFGTFGAAVNYTVGNGPVAVVVRDFNGDGRADLAIVNRQDGTVSVLLGSPAH